MLKKINRINSRKDFLEIKSKGQLYSGPFFGGLCLKTNDERVRFGFIVSKKISKRAVDRNKIKRRMSEVLKVNLEKFSPGTKIIFLAKKSLLEAKREEIEKEVIKILDSRCQISEKQK